ncbi:hypothetical protein Pmani_011816 [Petrolisthes manimaculis]|uniref:Ionotropic glutamate receptor L-glutamate and glycine-binding domain-containing protein n=1 Tax=Petrolisthes manimaculis TaxID=1843537 RepID=A0AAE1PZX7_9EUCA|nr:hypothetical protein Pmani_011816 [Petrolisthes manimaculis]
MRVRFQILRPPDGLWGVEMENGTWNGMLGMLQRQEVDMALGPFAISYPRTQVADFIGSVFVLPHRVYLPRPRGNSDVSDFVRLYHPLVCDGFMVSGNTGNNEYIQWSTSGFTHRTSCPHTNIISEAAGGTVTAALETGTRRHYTSHLQAEVPLYKELLYGSSGVFPDCYAARRDITQGRFAALCDLLSGELMIARSFSTTGRCDFYSPRENVVTHSYTLVVQKQSSLKPRLQYWLQELQERGWVDQLVRQKINNGTQCRVVPGKEEGQRIPTPLLVDQVWGVFAIWGVGLASAGVMFCIEVTIKI